MADQDFNFDEFLSEPKKQEGQKKSGASNTTSNTRTTNKTLDTIHSDDTEMLHPFSARLNKDYIEKIKAIAWWKRVSQRAFIELAVDLALKEMEDDKVSEIISSYRKNKE